MRRCSWQLQWEIEAMDRLHCGATLWRGHTPPKGNWQCLSGSGLLDGCHVFLFTFQCFPSFQQWPCLTSIGKINLNKLKTKQNKWWLVWQRYVCNKNYTPDQHKQREETELEKRGERGWLVGKRSNPNRLWLGTEAETLVLPAVLYKWSRIGWSYLGSKGLTLKKR